MENSDPKNALLRDIEVMRQLGLRSRSTLWRHVRSGFLPKPIRIGGATRWIADEIAEVVQRAAAERDPDAAD